MLDRLIMPLYLIGLAALYLAERTLTETARWAVDGVGAAALTAALLLNVWRWQRATAQRRSAHGWLAAAYLTATSGAAGYFALQRFAGDLPPKAAVAAQVVWPALLLLGLLPALAMESSVGSMRQAPTLELWRVRLAARAAGILALSIVAFAALNYTANVWNRKIDLSYFKTTRVGSATAAIARDLTQKVNIVLFFPAGNDVLEQVRSYTTELAQHSQQIEVEVLDQALEPERARELKVRSNGNVVIGSDSRSEVLRLDLDAEEARTALRTLDADMQTRLLKVIRPVRVAYLTTGHNERDYVPGRDDKRRGLRDLKNILEMQGFSVRRLGLGEGLGREVPADASVVLVIGPTEPFSDAERTSLLRYLQRGGRALLAFDAEGGVTEEPLLAPLGLRVDKALLANEHFIVRLDANRGDNPYDLATNRASTHPIVSTVERYPERLMVVFPTAANVARLASVAPDVNVTMALHAMPNSWEDKNGNRKLDPPGESLGAFEFVAAVEKSIKTSEVQEAATADPNGKAGDANKFLTKNAAPPPLRAVVAGDADFLSDGVLRVLGNSYLLVDTLRWLAGDEKQIGTTESEADVPLVRRKEDDALWFYGVSFLIPAAILFGGLAYARRRGGHTGRRQR